MEEIPGWATLREHRSAVRTLDFSSDGRRLVSGDEEGWVVLWTLETRRPLAVWRGHENALLATKFWGKDGELVVTHGRDNMLKIWTTAGHAVAHPGGHQGSHEVSHPGSHEELTEPPKITQSDQPTLNQPNLVHSQMVNTLNFCPVALKPVTSSQLMFATPATTASEKIDVYELSADFRVSRPFKALGVEDEEEEVVEGEGRRGLGTVMCMAFVGEWLVGGYESGDVVWYEGGEVRGRVKVSKSPVLAIANDPNEPNEPDEVRQAPSEVSERLANPTNNTSPSPTNTSPETPEVTERPNTSGTTRTSPNEPGDAAVGATPNANAFVGGVGVLIGAGRKLSYVTPKHTHVIARLNHVGISSISVSHPFIVTSGWDGYIRFFSKAAELEEPKELREEQAFKGGRDGISSAAVSRVSAPATRRLRPLPAFWVAAAGKNGRVGLFAP